MSVSNWSLGKDVSLVVVGPLGIMELPNITSFEAKPKYKDVSSAVLDGPPITKSLPDGWDGSISFDRTSVDVDSLISFIEGNFWAAGGDVTLGTIYEYVTEKNGTTSSFEFTDVSFKFDTGSWKSDTSVQMKLSFYARYRNRI